MTYKDSGEKRSTEADGAIRFITECKAPSITCGSTAARVAAFLWVASQERPKSFFTYGQIARAIHSLPRTPGPETNLTKSVVGAMCRAREILRREHSTDAGPDPLREIKGVRGAVSKDDLVYMRLESTMRRAAQATGALIEQARLVGDPRALKDEGIRKWVRNEVMPRLEAAGQLSHAPRLSFSDRLERAKVKALKA